MSANWKTLINKTPNKLRNFGLCNNFLDYLNNFCLDEVEGLQRPFAIQFFNHG